MKTIIVKTKEQFRKWLEKNHDKGSKVSVVLYKRHTSEPAPTHRELIEEAICFGWIDTTIKRLDGDRFVRNFSKRNKNSKWSNNTISYGKQLIKQGRMTSVGLKYYEEGLSRPTQDAHIPKNPDMPEELCGALEKNKTAKANFEKFPPSTKKMIYRWLLRGKLDETRKKRIKKIIEQAKAGKRDVFSTQEKING